MELLQNFYETTLEALKEAKNDRLWFKTNTKLGKLYFDREEYVKLQKILKQLHLSCQVIFRLIVASVSKYRKFPSRSRNDSTREESGDVFRQQSWIGLSKDFALNWPCC